MDIKSVKSSLEKNNKVIFSQIQTGLHYIWADISLLKITFTTDTPDYKGEDLESILEEFYAKFYVTNFQINVHIHKGEKHDKDITLTLIKNEELAKLAKNIKGIEIGKLSDLDRMAEIIYFIMNKFYKVNNWKYNFMN